MISKIAVAVGALAGGLVVLAYVFMVAIPEAREDERALIRAETLDHAIDLYQKRSRDNADVQKLDDAAVCRELGGVWGDGVCG